MTRLRTARSKDVKFFMAITLYFANTTIRKPGGSGIAPSQRVKLNLLFLLGKLGLGPYKRWMTERR